MNKKVIVGLVLLMGCFLLTLITALILLYVFYWNKPVVPTDNSGSITPTVNQTTTQTSTPTAPVSTKVPVAVLKANSLYMCKYQSKDVLYTNNGEGRYRYIYTFDGTDVAAENYGQLTSCYTVYEGRDREEMYVGAYNLSDDKKTLFVGITMDSTNAYAYPDTSIFVKFNTENQEASNVFVHNLFGHATGADPFMAYNGAINPVDFISNKYLIFSLDSCYGCGGSVAMYYVLNTETNNFTALMSNVGGFTINTALNIVKYRELVSTGMIPDCMMDPCDILTPTGTEHQTTLP